MALDTRPQFYYGYEITNDNKFLNFDEGGGELTAVLNFGSYAPSELATEIARALNAVATTDFTCVFNRSDRSFTVSRTGNFELLVSTGSNIGAGVFGLIGFTGSDRTGAATYTGSSNTGSQYRPQFLLQDYLDADHNRELIQPAVNESASGLVETIFFGERNFYEFNIRYINEIAGNCSSVIEQDTSAISNITAWLNWATKKKTFEFMPNRLAPGIFDVVLLESIDGSSTGTGYRLQELVGENLPNFYETGIIRLRVVV